jgi:hypothetical protein
MNRHEYQCPGCNGKDISFLRIEKVGTDEEKAIFFCHFCQKEFGIVNLRGEYLPNMVSILKGKYPFREAVKPP